jgi:hypothetical protein
MLNKFFRHALVIDILFFPVYNDIIKCGDGAHHKSGMLMAPALMNIIITAGVLIFIWKRL